MTKHILVLTKYSRMGASSRLRTFQYLPFLEGQDLKITVQSLFDDNYLKRLYSNQNHSMFDIINYYLRRLYTLTKVKQYDLIWIEKELFPYTPPLIEYFLSLIGCKYIVDYDDAVFHNYDLSKNKLTRLFLSKKIDSVMKHSKCVIAGNSYLESRAKKAGAQDTQIIPTVVDHLRYNEHKTEINTILTIGWVGSPTTQKYIVEILTELQKTYKIQPFRLLLIGATQDILKDLPGLNVETIDWDEQSEAYLISNMDIGIMPLHDGPWEKGKCGYKLIQYMACGLPVVASDVGVNRQIIEYRNCGIVVSNYSEWSDALTHLLSSAELRSRYGKEGRASVETKYSLYAQLPILKNILTSLV